MKIIVVQAGSHAPSWEYAVELQTEVGPSEKFRFDFRGTKQEAEQYRDRLLNAAYGEMSSAQNRQSDIPAQEPTGALQSSGTGLPGGEADPSVQTEQVKPEPVSQGSTGAMIDYARMSDDGGAHTETEGDDAPAQQN